MYFAIIECYETLRDVSLGLLTDDADQKIIWGICHEVESSIQQRIFLREFNMSGLPLLLKVDKSKLLELAGPSEFEFSNVCTSMNDLCFDVFGTTKEKKDSKEIKGNRELFDALPEKRRIEDGCYASDNDEDEETSGLKHGRAIVVSTCAAVASIVTGVIAGMLALGERLPSAPLARLLLLIGWLFIILGVILLVASTQLMRHLRRSWRQERSFGGLKQPGLVRASSRDTSLSAVIQTSTLHHLISTSSKPKA